jgi:hypothetical protein
MTTRLFARRTLAFTAAAAALLLTACGADEVGAKKLKPIKEGMAQDSIYAFMGTGPLTATFAADSARLDHGFRRSIYIVDGKTIHVIYYREQPGNVAENLYQDTETPIVVVNKKVEGWGWKAYKKAMKEYNLPANVTPRDSVAPAKAAAPAPAPTKDTTKPAGPGPKA